MQARSAGGTGKELECPRHGKPSGMSDGMSKPPMATLAGAVACCGCPWASTVSGKGTMTRHGRKLPAASRVPSDTSLSVEM